MLVLIAPSHRPPSQGAGPCLLEGGSEGALDVELQLVPDDLLELREGGGILGWDGRGGVPRLASCTKERTPTRMAIFGTLSH